MCRVIDVIDVSCMCLCNVIDVIDAIEIDVIDASVCVCGAPPSLVLRHVTQLRPQPRAKHWQDDHWLCDGPRLVAACLRVGHLRLLPLLRISPGEDVRRFQKRGGGERVVFFYMCVFH